MNHMNGSSSYRPKFGYDIRIKREAPRDAPSRRHPCGVVGCPEYAESRAPRSRENMDERVWLCREHLRAHNENWNFFAGMTEEDIQRFCVEAIVGHRPTWPLGRLKASRAWFSSILP